MESPTSTAIKICGITNSNQAKAIAALGVYAIGVIGVKSSPRYLQDLKRSRLFADMKTFAPKLELVWVIADFSDDQIAKALEGNGAPTIIQLHGSESPNRCTELRKKYPNIKWWKAIRINTALEIKKAHQYEPYVDALLLDAWSPKELGGTGKRASLDLLKTETFKIPWWLAGGISADWIPEIFSHGIQPFGIDASSRLENCPGEKDLTKVSDLIKSVKNATTQN